MGKKIPLKIASPAKEAIGNFLADAKKMLSETKSEYTVYRESVLQCILELVNDDVCVNDQQASYISSSVSNAIQAVIDKQTSSLNVENIVTMVNSFRNDCENCINSQCKYRDPEKPYTRKK